MSDAASPAPPEEGAAPPPADRTDAREHRGRWPGLVWAIPAAAILIIAYLGLQALAHGGVDVVVTFNSAADAKPGDTQVIYKGLSVGRVSKVRLSQDRKHVDMTLRLDPSLKPILNRDTKFWLVGAKPSLTDISSLKAALAGVSIGIAPGGGPPARRFDGLDEPPVVMPGTAGTEFQLFSPTVGSARPGASVFYHGDEVGKVTAQTLRAHDDFSTRVFIEAPYDRFVKRGTLFYNTSAVQVSFSGSGLSTQLAPGNAALGGGVEFETPPEFLNEPQSRAETVFALYPDKGRAIVAPRGPQVFYTIAFTDPVGELDVGSAVKLRGFQVGTVTARTIRFNPATGVLSTPVTIAIEPDRLDPAGGVSAPTADLTVETDATIAKLVSLGYRARLAQTPPIVGGRVVDLVRVSGARPAALQGARLTAGDSFPAIPATSSGDVTALMAKADDILGKVQQVPIAEIGADVRSITKTLNQLISSPKVKDSLDHLDSTLAQIDQTVKETKPKIGPLVDKLNSAADQLQSVVASANGLVSTDGSTQDASVPAALRQLTDAARSLRALADYLGRHPEAILRGKASGR